MEGALAAYGALSGGFVTLLQKAGLLTIPLGLAITAIINYLGGERALKAVGVAILVISILNVILAFATGLGNWMGGLTTSGAGVLPTAVPKPG